MDSEISRRVEAQYVNERLLFSGLPPAVSIQLRLQNTMNGKVVVLMFDSDSRGKANLIAPRNFGQHFAPTLIVLDSSYPADNRTTLHYVAEGSRYLTMRGALPIPPQPKAQTASTLGGTHV